MNEPRNAAASSEHAPAALAAVGQSATESPEYDGGEGGAAAIGAGQPPTPLPKIIRFAALARCGDEIWIENDGQIYRLRKTRQGKLILTK